MRFNVNFLFIKLLVTSSAHEVRSVSNDLRLDIVSKLQKHKGQVQSCVKHCI